MPKVAKKASPSLNADEIHVGQMLRERRMAMKMSQTQLGAVVDVSFQQIQKYERGINRVAFSTLQKFAEALETPIQYFLKDTGSQSSLASPIRQAPFLMPAKDTQELLKLFAEIEDPAVRKQVLQLARALVTAQDKPAGKKKSK